MKESFTNESLSETQGKESMPITNDVNSAIPEEWIENIEEAQKEAYRIKILAFMDTLRREGVNNSAPWSKDWSKLEGKNLSQIQPSAEDYEKASLVYKDLFERDLSQDPKLAIFGNWIAKLFIEWRARLLAKAEAEAEMEKGKKEKQV